MSEETKNVICPDCGNNIKIYKETVVGDILECEECGTEVELLSLDPLKYQELVEEK